jgi:hypothetical protein
MPEVEEDIAATISRDEFVGVVENAINSVDGVSPELAERMREVAKTQTRFLVGDYELHGEHCLIGEMRHREGLDPDPREQACLKVHPDNERLQITLGTEIDDEVRRLVYDREYGRHLDWGDVVGIVEGE